jgi:PAS domain S-box-containing protein
LILGMAQDVTDRKQMEETQTRLLSILESASDFIGMADISGRALYLNRAGRRMMGLAVDTEITQLTVADHHPAWVNDLIVREGIPVASRDGVWAGETAILTNDGNEIPVWQVIVAHKDASGKVTATSTIARDITERKQNEQKLRENEQRLRVMVENLPAGALYRDGDRVFSNRGVEQLTGYSSAEITTIDQWFSMLYGQEASVVRALYEQDRDANFPSDRTVPLTRKDGQIRTVEFAAYKDESAEVWLVHDITDRKQAEEALRESEERYRELFENANDIVYTHDLAGHFTSLNRAGERITGYTRDEILTMGVAQIVAPEYRERARQMIVHKVDERDVTVYELEIVAKDGHRVTLEVSTRLIYQSDRPVGVQGIARDITERKQAEKEKEQLQRQLAQVQRLEALGTLAGGIAHDFNNLLTPIVGFAELTMDDVPPGTIARRNLEEILQASRRAKTLVQQILTFSRSHQQRDSPIQLQQVVEETLALLRITPLKNVQIHAHLAAPSETLLANSVQMQQVLMNLCVNAFHAMQEKGGVLEVGLERVEVDQDSDLTRRGLEPRPHLRLTVRDSGYGMTPETRERIFEPFFTTKPTGEGNGMGLAIVHGIVTGHHGTITVESQPGEGATFDIYLPVLDGKERGAQP